MHIEDLSSSAPEGMAEPWEAGPAWAAWVLNKVGMTEEEAVADMSVFKDKARDCIRRSNASGFRDVFKVGDKWQAKVYVGPGDQRGMGSFEQPEDAAKQVLMYLCTGDAPPKPEKQRRKRGEAQPKQPKRPRHSQQASPATPLAELPAQPITPATFASMGMYTAPCFEGADPEAPTVAAIALVTM